MAIGAGLIGWSWFETPGFVVGPAADLVIFGLGGFLLIAMAIPRAAFPGVVAILRREFDRSGSRDEPPDGQPLSKRTGSQTKPDLEARPGGVYRSVLPSPISPPRRAHLPVVTQRDGIATRATLPDSRSTGAVDQNGFVYYRGLSYLAVVFLGSSAAFAISALIGAVVASAPLILLGLPPRGRLPWVLAPAAGLAGGWVGSVAVFGLAANHVVEVGFPLVLIGIGCAGVAGAVAVISTDLLTRPTKAAGDSQSGL